MRAPRRTGEVSWPIAFPILSQRVTSLELLRYGMLTKVGILAGTLGAAYLIAIGFVFLRPNSHFILELLAAQYLLLLPAVVLVGFANSKSNWLQRLQLPRAGFFYLIYAAIVLFMSLGMHKGIFGGDESSYRFQSRIFLNGRLVAEAPPQIASDEATYKREFRFHHHVIYQGKWFSKYPPGWPAVLALGSAVNIDWLVNPILAGLIVWIGYRISILVFDESVGRIALSILLASPYFLLNSIGFMPHPLCGALLAGSSLLFFQGIKNGRTSDFVWMQILIACSLLVRPLTGAVVAVVLGAGMLWHFRRRPGRFGALLATGALIASLAVGTQLAYNRALTGSVWMNPYSAARGLGASLPAEVTLNPAGILANIRTITRWSLESTILYAFPFVLLLALYAVFREREHRWEARILGALFGALVVGYTVQTEPSGTHFGERYYYETYFAIAILSARGAQLLAGGLQLRSAVASGLLLLSAAVLQCVLLVSRAGNEWKLERQERDVIAEIKIVRGVVFLPHDYGLDANSNAADWRQASVFYMVDPGASRRAAIVCGLGYESWVALTETDEKQLRVERSGTEACKVE